MIKDYVKINPDDNTVLTVVVAEGNDDLDIRTKLEKSTGWLKENWVAAPEDEEHRFKHCGIGCTYNKDTGLFLRKKPFASWSLNSDGTDWEPPISNPNNLSESYWNEQTQSWLEQS